MEEPQQEVGDGRELKGGLPGGVWFLVAFVSLAQNLDLLVSFVVKEHSGHDGEVDEDKGSSEYEAALADEAPWRMADPKEDGLLRGQTTPPCPRATYIHSPGLVHCVLEEFVPLAGSAASSPWAGEEWKTWEHGAPGSTNRKNVRLDCVVELSETIRARGSKKQKVAMQSKVEVEGVERKSSGRRVGGSGFSTDPTHGKNTPQVHGRQARLPDSLIWTWPFSTWKG